MVASPFARPPRRRTMSARWLGTLLAALTLALPARAEPKPGLDIYFIDTEGGASRLIAPPKRGPALTACGTPGVRAAERIHEVATKQANLEAIAHLITTHWHSDHSGGAARLSKLIPIRHYYDRGIPKELEEDK